ncbi:PorT family protein [Porphyromonadaceae bacterium OttesenSCG-928-L07]|nr:PorT family protein [Porphyromonadaceae bacterium OttesenSCG-928-L07]MDL2252051.1 PorT family protein [Odoribacter sp. OttesenSCG-928-J03]MDL2283401.1 PorT family protein [Odoribacter sp. OttesenSCG-928-G04]
MKKYVLLVFAMCLFLFADAQSFSVGAKGGLNISNISNREGDSKTSFHLGSFQRYRFNDNIGVQVDLLYSRQGFKDHGDHKFWYRADYLNIPVMAKVYLFRTLSLDFGPQLGILLSGETKEKSGRTKIITKNKDIHTLDISLAMGLSYEFLDNFNVELRYNVGLTNVEKKSRVGNTNKHEVFQISLGYRLLSF